MILQKTKVLDPDAIPDHQPFSRPREKVPDRADEGALRPPGHKPLHTDLVMREIRGTRPPSVIMYQQADALHA